MKFRIATTVGALALGLMLLACGGSPADEAQDTPSTPAASVDAVTPPPASKAAPKVTQTTKAVSTEQRNATQQAESYLDGQSFSRKGLIEQLKYEGYPATVATAAVASLHVDWNKQAALSAKSYLNGQSFSRKGLIEQLEYEGFSHTQAVYGVNQAGL